MIIKSTATDTMTASTWSASIPDLTTASRILVSGQRVTFDRYPTGWVATGWEQGLPVRRCPVDESYLQQVLSRFPEQICWTI